MERKKISLWNRYGDNVVLIPTETSEIYKLDGGEYMRVIGDDQDYPEAVDPSGGPYLSIGSEQRGTVMESDERRTVIFSIDEIEWKKGEGFFLTIKDLRLWDKD